MAWLLTQLVNMLAQLVTMLQAKLSSSTELCVSLRAHAVRSSISMHTAEEACYKGAPQCNRALTLAGPWLSGRIALYCSRRRRRAAWRGRGACSRGCARTQCLLIAHNVTWLSKLLTSQNSL